jgi:hypothetical protein
MHLKICAEIASALGRKNTAKASITDSNLCINRFALEIQDSLAAIMHSLSWGYSTKLTA